MTNSDSPNSALLDRRGNLSPENGHDDSLGALTLCVAAATGFGALNEVIEFAITLLVPENNVGGYVNTAMDLVYNLAGAVLAALWLRAFYRPVADEVR